MWQVLRAKTTKILGITLILCGAMMMILQIACTAINEEMGTYLVHIGGTGIWCGLLILISGVVGCCAAVRKTKALVRRMKIWVLLCNYITQEFEIHITVTGKVLLYCRSLLFWS